MSLLIRKKEINISNIKLNQVRIYKLDTFNCFTEEENNLYNKKQSEELRALISSFTGVRTIPKKYLYVLDKQGKVVGEKTKNQIAVFENDLARLSTGEEFEDLSLVKEIVYFEINHNEILNQIINNGLIIDDRKFILDTSTTGQTRENTITLIADDFYNNHKENLMCGLTIDRINEVGINTGKFLAYTALPLSASKAIYDIDIDKCIVVKDFETIISDTVKYLDIKTMEFETKQMDIPIQHMDGAGLFLPDLLPSSCQIRGRYIKGCIFPFDFRKFALEVAHDTTVIDAWNTPHDIIAEDIQYILTESQFKMKKYYKSWQEYKNFFKANGIKISINNFANPPKNKVKFAYQFLQTLDNKKVTTDYVHKLADPTIQYIKDLHTDTDTVLKALGIEEDKKTESISRSTKTISCNDF